MQADIPFVTLSHVSPIQEGEDDAGFDFYQRLLAFAADQSEQNSCELTIATLSELTGETENQRPST
jgi:hypothetical protein